MEIVTSEEKIDYIYHTLKKNERKAIIGCIFKWGYRIAILGYMYYFLTIGLPATIDKLIPHIPQIPGMENFSGDSIKLNKDQFQELYKKYISK